MHWLRKLYFMTLFFSWVAVFSLSVVRTAEPNISTNETNVIMVASE
jgi:hypothetical protein